MLRALGDAPARSLTALAQQLGVPEADPAIVVTPLEEEPLPLATVPASPLWPMTAPSGGSSAPKTLLTILFLSATHGGRVHAKRIAEATPCPLPTGSRLVQDLGFRACTLPQVEILMPTKKPRGEELTREQHRANQALSHCEGAHPSVEGRRPRPGDGTLLCAA